jgi:hypothetical protein
LTLAAVEAGFNNIQWHEAEDISFFQPAMTALGDGEQGVENVSLTSSVHGTTERGNHCDAADRG